MGGIPRRALQNNLSEQDIRDYVKKRKISGSTRSEQGRRCRDTFASIKKTCRKNAISFWEYLNDRLRNAHQLPQLAGIVTACRAALATRNVRHYRDISVTIINPWADSSAG